MAPRELRAVEVGLVRFAVEPASASSAFDLTSHARAREALDLALSVPNSGFNVFVVGDDRSGRMTATLSFLRQRMAGEPPPQDWVYLNNFRRPHRPKPCALPAGLGRRLCDTTAALVGMCRTAIARAFADERYRKAIQDLSLGVQHEIDRRLQRLQERARAAGLDLVRTEGGMAIVALSGAGETGLMAPPDGQHDPSEDAARSLQRELAELGQQAARLQSDLAHRARELNREVAGSAIAGLVEAAKAEFKEHRPVVAWLRALNADILDNLDLIRSAEQGDQAQRDAIEHRYAINLFVDNADATAPEVVVEPTPTEPRLFGRIEYRQIAGALTTDHTLIRAGALHRANGGVLVLRAEAVAQEPGVWEALKGALRDRVIRITQPSPADRTRLAGSPDPKSVPLKLKVVLVGSPRWYYSFFAMDPDFQTYFKIKADIAPDMPADRDNVARYAAIIHAMAREIGGAPCSGEAMQLLLGFSARRAENRNRLSARFELMADILTEATQRGRSERAHEVSASAVLGAFAARRDRNARVEERLHEDIAGGRVLIDTEGRAAGQVNALVVHDLGDHEFGLPVRVTARCSVGRRGIVNIERDVTLGGPIQQKAVMVIQGFLAGRFARTRPLSFNCSLTFEQSYGGVEGDSASLAELLAVLSELSRIPLRQDIAVSGSVNQMGTVQAVGGVSHKIEGFFRTCLRAGSLTGTQGVLLPESNKDNVVLMPEISEAVAAGLFHVWTARSVEEAVELMTGKPAGVEACGAGYPERSVYRAVADELDEFNHILMQAGLGRQLLDA